VSSYANSPRGRAVLIGTALVLSAAMLVRPVMFLVGCALVLVLGQRQLARLFPARQSVADHADTLLRFAPGFLVAAGTTWMLFAAHLPMDELLRHILARGWGYDYASHYGNHFVDQHWSYWIGFDWAVGAVHAATGDILTTSRIVRAAIFVAVGSAVVAAVNRAHPDRAIRFAATAAILVGFLWLRLNLGRPEVLFTGLIISALALPRLVWLGFFLLLVPTYWLAPVYAVGAMLLGRHGDPWRGRLLRNLGVALAGVAASVAFWWHYSDGTVLHTVTLLGQVVQNHAEASRPIGEMMPLTEGTRSPLVLGLMGLLVVTAWKCGNSGAAAAARSTIVACLAVACYFCLPDYVRYAPTIWSLLLLAMLMIAGDVRTSSAARPWILAGLAMLVMLGMRPLTPRRACRQPCTHVLQLLQLLRCRGQSAQRDHAHLRRQRHAPALSAARHGAEPGAPGLRRTAAARRLRVRRRKHVQRRRARMPAPAQGGRPTPVVAGQQGVPMKLELVVSAFGQSPHLVSCLRSLVEQQAVRSGRAGIVVATSTPSPELEAAAACFGARYAVNPVRCSIGADWNFALSTTRAPLVAICHQDDTYHPQFATKMLELFTSDPGLLMASSSYAKLDGDGREQRSVVLTVKRFLMWRAFGGETWRWGPSIRRRMLSWGNPVCCSSVVLNRQQLEDFRFDVELGSQRDQASLRTCPSRW